MKNTTTTEAELVRTLRAITRHQTHARKLRRQLKKTLGDLRLERKHLRALQAALEARRPDVAPMRLFAGAVGMSAPAPTLTVTPGAADAIARIAEQLVSDLDGGES